MSDEIQAKYNDMADFKQNMKTLTDDTASTGDEYDQNRKGFGDFGVAKGWGGTAAQAGVATTEELATKLRRLESLMNKLDTATGVQLNEMAAADKVAEAQMNELQGK